MSRVDAQRPGSYGASREMRLTQATKPFADALRDLIVELGYTTENGRPNWSAFAVELDGTHYETLRRAAIGESPPSARLIEECARALRLRPEYFVEYRAYLAQRDFDPDEVGFEQALRNVEKWAAARASSNTR